MLLLKSVQTLHILGFDYIFYYYLYNNITLSIYLGGKYTGAFIKYTRLWVYMKTTLRPKPNNVLIVRH